MSFGEPIWFWGLVTLPLLVALYLAAERRSAAKLQEFVAPRLLNQLAANVDRRRRLWRFSSILLALALAILALAKPRWGYTYEEVRRRGLDLLLAVDTSRSMLSNDVAPNRLERVKLATQDLLNELRGDRVGLIAFAGRAFLQAPLTIDYGAAVESINDLDTKTIPEGGTNISDAIALATRTLSHSAQGNRVVIIFTDGEELSGDAIKEAKNAAENGVRIFTIGVGTPQGSLIPLAGEGGSSFVKDEKGQVVKSKLDETRLREIAQATGGSYLHLENGPATMRQLYEQGLAKMQAGEFDARLSRRPIERYQWPLGAAIMAATASIFINDRRRARRHGGRVRPTLVSSAAALLLISPNAFGAAPGLDAYGRQDYKEALRQFQGTLEQHPRNPATDKLEFDSGAAAYKLKEYDKALQAFSQALLSPEPALQSKGHYNLGNTLYQHGEAEQDRARKLGDWKNALKQYQETLRLEPQNREAKENYDFVKKKIDELNKPDQQPSPSPKPQDKKDQKDQQKEDQQQSDQNSKQNNQDQKDKDQQNQPQQNRRQQQKQSDKSDKQQSPQSSQDQKSSPKDQEKDQQQNSGNGPEQQQKPEEKGASPTPSPGPTQPNTPGSSPSPSSEGSNEAPSPSPTASGSPEPTAGNESGKGSSPTPGPSASPAKPKSGEIKGAGEPDQSQQQKEAAAAEAEAEQRGEMTPQQAESLLQAMKDEEARVQLDERKGQRPVYKDW